MLQSLHRQLEAMSLCLCSIELPISRPPGVDAGDLNVTNLSLN